MPSVITEKHPTFVKPPTQYLVSTDGSSIYDMDAHTWNVAHAGADIRFLWGLRFNLREIADPGQAVPPPKKRTAAPSLQYLEAIVRLSRPRGEAPAKMPGAIAIKRPALYKPFAEDSQGTEDARENKPVLIVKAKAPHAEILAANGRSIGRLAYGGEFAGGLHRYYAGGRGGVNLYGHQIGEKAAAAAGSEFVWFQVARKIYGPVNPAFRAGYFR